MKRRKYTTPRIRDFVTADTIRVRTYHKTSFEPYISSTTECKPLHDNVDTESKIQRIQDIITFKNSKRYTFSNINRFLRRTCLKNLSVMRIKNQNGVDDFYKSFKI